MKSETIGIIGGKGKIGSVFADYFANKGFPVLVSDIGTKLKNSDVAKMSDILILSVPISKVSSVAAEVGPHMKKDALFVDFTSLKTEPIHAMKDAFSGEILGIHPMFGPTNLTAGQTVVFCPGRGKKWKKRMKNIFSDFQIVEMTAEEHDRCMALVQGLQHFMEATYGATLAAMNMPIKTLLAVASPIYRLQMGVVGRVLSQDEKMYSNIVFGSQYSRSAIHTFLQEAEKLAGGGLQVFEQEFCRGRKYFGKFSAQAQRESDAIIDAMSARFAHHHQKKEKHAKVDMGVLGPQLTWSDLAAEHFFPHKSREWYPNFSLIFSALEKGKIKMGFCPIENKISGTVCEVWDELSTGKYWIESVHDFPINHLLAASNKQKPRVIFGHAAAIAQCRKSLQKHYPHARLVPVASNSEAVSRAKNVIDSAAICSPEAANAAHFSIIRKEISDQKGNTTRFARVVKRTKKEKYEGKQMTSLFFELLNVSGSLFSALKIFRDAKLNMSRLESRPVGKQLSQYAFFVDIDGTFPPECEEQLVKVTKNLRILGHYSVEK